YVGKKGAVFFFRSLSVGNIFENVNGAKFPSTGIREFRIGHQKISGKPGVRIVAFAGDSLTVRAQLVRRVFDRKKFTNAPTNHGLTVAAQEMPQSLVASQDAPLPIVDQDRVTDGVERVFPLVLDR